MDQNLVLNLSQWSSAVLGLLGSGLMGKKVRVAWILWYVSSSVGFLWAVQTSVIKLSELTNWYSLNIKDILFYKETAWGFAFMQFIYVILAIRGWMNWGKCK